MGLFGGLGGGLIGGGLGSLIGQPALGAGIGGMLGKSLLPFSTGGKVPGAKGRPVKAIVHGGEYVLPANAKPTKAQKAIVAKNKRGKK